jgi:hypothetical protein
MITPFDGFDSWYNQSGVGATNYVHQIDNNGYVSTSTDCSTL